MSNKTQFIHIPRTGGASFMRSAYKHTHHSDPDYVYSLFGTDKSQGKNLLSLMEQSIHYKSVRENIISNDHFINSKLIGGHISYGVMEEFTDYDWSYFTIIRDPVERVVSNIYQLSLVPPRSRVACLGSSNVPNKVDYLEEFWEAVLALIKFHGVCLPGLYPHEAMFMENCMCRLLTGQNLTIYEYRTDIELAKSNAENITFALFENYNETINAGMKELGLDIVLDHEIGSGNPNTNLGRDIMSSCPDELIEIIMQNNTTDIELYNYLKREKILRNKPS